jgi:hypothetical protein
VDIANSFNIMQLTCRCQGFPDTEIKKMVLISTKRCHHVFLRVRSSDIISAAKQEFETNPVTDADQYEKVNVERAEDEPTTSTEDLAMTEIQGILAEFTNIEGVHTACLVGRDGFLLDSLARADIDAEMIAAIASSGFGSAESMGNQLGQGDLRMTMFEFENGPVMFAPVGEDAFLVIVAEQDTNLGWIRISIKKNSKKIQEVALL